MRFLGMIKSMLLDDSAHIADLRVSPNRLSLADALYLRHHLGRELLALPAGVVVGGGCLAYAVVSWNCFMLARSDRSVGWLIV